jgi:replicative DNA helicase
MSKAEQNLLGALILDPRQFKEISKIVASADFEEWFMGRVFDGISEMIATGLQVDQITVHNRWAEWQIKSDPTQIYNWATAEVYPFMAGEYARAVRRDSVKRSLRHLANDLVLKSSDPSIEPLDVAANAANFIESLRNSSTTGELVTKRLGEILEGDDAYDWLIPGLLERQDRLIVTGPEGFGKTTFIRQIAILAAAGINPMTFDRITPIRVLVVDAENTERQWRRAVRNMTEMAARLGSADPKETMHIAAGHRIDVTKGSHLSEIHRLIDTHKPDMVMIGPLYKLVPKAITNDDDAAPLIVALDSLRERGVCLIMEAHAGKAQSQEGERDLRPRGSAALLGWPEFGFGLRPTADKEVVAISRWRGDRDERNWPKKMRRGGRWPWIPEELFEMVK